MLKIGLDYYDDILPTSVIFDFYCITKIEKYTITNYDNVKEHLGINLGKDIKEKFHYFGGIENLKGDFINRFNNNNLNRELKFSFENDSWHFTNLDEGIKGLFESFDYSNFRDVFKDNLLNDTRFYLVNYKNSFYIISVSEKDSLISKRCFNLRGDLLRSIEDEVLDNSLIKRR